VRHAALEKVSATMTAPGGAFENAAGLVPFFAQLSRAAQDGTPVHILQYGDSHTASDDWANTLRQNFQSKFGCGGPGFILPGHPFRGYRRFDTSGSNSAGWHTEGLVGRTGDGRYGLGGLSISTSAAGETVTLTAECDSLELCYLQQPGGGSLEIEEDGAPAGTVSTDGEIAAGFFAWRPGPGVHHYSVRTLSPAPVRLFGWVADRSQGATVETLGINGAQVAMMTGWDESLLAAQIAERDPALILVAYGTNEALSPKWEAATYRQSLIEAIGRLRQASPTASIVMIGPPDCFLRTRHGLVIFPHLNAVIDIQREVAHELRCPFWDWRERMGGPGSKKLWVRAGLGQPDYVHLTPAGYQLVGRTLFDDLMTQYQDFLKAQTAALESKR
jgi:lysophospholipase L1-like esterase